jgi:hypothetical protein
MVAGDGVHRIGQPVECPIYKFYWSVPAVEDVTSYEHRAVPFAHELSHLTPRTHLRLHPTRLLSTSNRRME